jgi:hypothetical protein
MNSFTFKKAKKVQCYHDDKTHIMLAIFDYWHWSYEYNQKQLDIWFATTPTKWATSIPVQDFSIKVQTSIYYRDARLSAKRRPVYSKENVDWNKDSAHCVSFSVKFFGNHFNLSFSEKVYALYGDDIITIVETMRGFFAEFKEELKKIKSFDLKTVDDVLCNMSCRLCKFGINNSIPQIVRDEKMPKRYTILPVTKPTFDEETIITHPLPF